VKVLEQAIEDEAAFLPLLITELARLYLEQIDQLSERIGALEKTVAHEAKCGATTRRLQTMPGVGRSRLWRSRPSRRQWTYSVAGATSPPGSALFLCSIRPEVNRFSEDLKMGQRDIRRLRISGAMVIVRWACRKGTPEGSWLHRMLARKPRMLVAIAIANKMARSIWAMLTKGEDYRAPVAVAA
jgi:transposase